MERWFRETLQKNEWETTSPIEDGVRSSWSVETRPLRPARLRLAASFRCACKRREEGECGHDWPCDGWHCVLTMGWNPWEPLEVGTLEAGEAWGPKARGLWRPLGWGVPLEEGSPGPLEQLINLQRGVWSSASCQGRGCPRSLSGIRDLNHHLCLF